MRIVLVFPDPPLPFGTAAARWYYVLLKGLRSHGHEVTAYAPFFYAPDAAEAVRLFPKPDYDLRLFAYPRRRGFRAKCESFFEPYSYIFGPDLRYDLARTLRKGFDILHLETQWAAWLAPTNSNDRKKCFVNVHSLYAVDLAKVLGGGFINRIRNWRVLISERKLLRMFPTLTTLSSELAGHLNDIAPGRKVIVIPLGFDAELYKFVPPPLIPSAVPTIGLIGSFNWYPTFSAGIRLLKEIWPAVREKTPKVRLLLAGRQVRAAMAAHLPDDPSDLAIAENVPDTMPYFRQLDAMVYLPVLGTGIKVKVLEAMALGIPVVTNRHGVEGLPAQDGIHAMIADDPSTQIQKTVELLSDVSLRRRLSENARRLVMDVCSPERVVAKFNEFYSTRFFEKSAWHSSRKKVLVLDQPRSFQDDWDEVQEKEKPDQVLFGINYLSQQGYDIEFVRATHKGGWLTRLLSSLLGHDVRLAWETFRHRRGDVIYAPYGRDALLLGLLAYFGLCRTPVLGMAHHCFLIGRAAGLRKPLLRISIMGFGAVAALTELAANEVALLVGSTRRVFFLSYAADLRYYPRRQTIGDRLITAGRTGRDLGTLFAALSQTSIPSDVVCLPAELSAQHTSPPACVKIWHHIQQPHLLELFKSARVVAIPLKRALNLHGLNSFIDALGMGRPIIMTRNPAFSFNIEKLGIGRWVEPGDVQGWNEAIKWFSEHKSEAEQMGVRARQMVDDGYSSQTFGEKLCRIVDGLIQSSVK